MMACKLCYGTNSVQHDVFLPCSWMLFRTVTLVFQSGTVLIAIYIFNLRRLQAKINVQTDALDELLYADDMDKNASSEAKMQRAIDQVSQSCDNYDLTISTKKTEVGHQPAPGKPYNDQPSL